MAGAGLSKFIRYGCAGCHNGGDMSMDFLVQIRVYEAQGL
jgi:hypothetical protein